MIVNQAALSGIYKSFNTVFNEAFDQAPSQWPLVAMEVPSQGRSVDYKWLGDFPTMREWLGDRVIKDLSGFHYELINKDYEATIEVDRNDIDDDQIGVYAPMIRQMGMSAKSHPDILVWALLTAGWATKCFDDQFFFSAAHPVGATTASNAGGGSGVPWFLMDLSKGLKPVILQIRKKAEFVAQDRVEDENVFMRKKFRYGVDDRKNVGFGLWQVCYGSKRAIDTTYYPAARVAMMAYTKDDNATKLGIVPTHLIHGPTSEAEARALIDNEHNAAGASNPWYKSVTRIMVPWLT